MTDQLELTQEEINLILKRRELFQKRQAQADQTPKNPAQAQQQPQGPSKHCDPSQIFRGKLVEEHPMYWFEKEVFQKISNMAHQEEHKKISELLGMPVQTNSRDRVYHSLCHLDVLWTENKLPVAFKHRYEAYKKKHNIGDDNIHPDHKKSGVIYATPKNKRPWNPEEYTDYDENEKFVGDR